MGNEKAIRIGANVIMPNVIPGMYCNNYNLYENNPCTDKKTTDCSNYLDIRIGITGDKIG